MTNSERRTPNVKVRLEGGTRAGQNISPSTALMPDQSQTSNALIQAAGRLRNSVKNLKFGPPVTHVYNPLDYAWSAHKEYLRRYGNTTKNSLFLGMNPGPFGMVQTGIPFGQVAAVRDWLKIQTPIHCPECQHAKRLVTGFDCKRSEISGERLWGLFAQRFHSPEKFFEKHFVANYCPLAFVEASGRNRTPDKLPKTERELLFARCDEHLSAVISTLQPEWLIAIGEFAAKRIQQVASAGNIRVARILHPSPASPAANKDWAAMVTAELQRLGIW